MLVGAGVVVALTKPFATAGASHPGVVNNSDPTGLQPVTRQDLSSQTQVSATLGYAGSYSAINQAQGTVTSLPSVGQVVTQGQVLYRVDGVPVVLLYGTTPAYRSLSEGAYVSDVTGTDVAELNADLVTLGYATSSEIPAGSDEFTWWTKDAVEKLQKALGVTQTGTLTLGQAVFEPTAVRVTSVSATLGASAQPGQPVLSATSTTRQVTIALDADQQSEVAVGDKVTITLPSNQTTPGMISSVGAVATAGQNGGSPTITVRVKPTDPVATGDWDQAPVNVTITTGSVSNALVVPVDALLAQAGGGYAVEVVGSGGIHHLAPVTLGLFDDANGLVQVTGTTLAVGDRIVVPAL
jgi:HlyD family secretion protein/Putative peptidoglycan binding domain